MKAKVVGSVKTKKKGKKSKHTVRQEVEAEARANKVEADGYFPSQPFLLLFTHTKPCPRHTDAKAIPSAESGGVPNPTQSYLLSALKPPRTLPYPRPILIVMDLNGTILHRPLKRNNLAAFVERPHANRFMQYCLDTFHVAIWSSAKPQNVKKMVSKLLTPEQGEKCIVVWSRDQLDLSPEDYNSRVQCYKRLKRVWEDPTIKASHPEGGTWDQSNTVLVDDSFEKGRSEPFNILALPKFANTALERQHVLPQVHDYLNQLACQEDVSRYMRCSPFKLDPAYTLPNSGI